MAAQKKKGSAKPAKKTPPKPVLKKGAVAKKAPAPPPRKALPAKAAPPPPPKAPAAAKAPPAPVKAPPPSKAPAQGAKAGGAPAKPGTASKAPPALAAPAAEPKAAKRTAVPTLAPAAAPVLKPMGAAGPAKVAQAPLPPPPKQGAMDQQLVSAIHYGLFAAINKTFGSFGQSVLKNASLRVLEYGYKRQWLPPKSKDPIKALNEFFQRLETMGYAERIHVGKKDDAYVCEIVNLADWDAIADLRELHYPLLPIFMNELILAFLDQYFKLIVAMEPVELVPEKRGLRIRFTTHERSEAAAVHVTERPVLVDFEE